MDARNKKLHELLGRGCWHEITRPQYGDSSNCKKCGAFVHFEMVHGEIRIPKNPDYCSDLNLVHEVEKEVIEKVGGSKWLVALKNATGADLGGTSATRSFILATATAHERVDALIDVLGSKEK